MLDHQFITHRISSVSPSSMTSSDIIFFHSLLNSKILFTEDILQSSTFCSLIFLAVALTMRVRSAAETSVMRQRRFLQMIYSQDHLSVTHQITPHPTTTLTRKIQTFHFPHKSSGIFISLYQEIMCYSQCGTSVVCQS